MLGLFSEFTDDLRREFKGYDAKGLRADVLAGITVAAVALPLALAFGVGSGADAAAGLITAIVSAFVIGALSGASYQISGPTGAMTAILIPLAVKHGLISVLAAGFIAGAFLIAAGILRAGKLVYLIPATVISGFTSGIAIIIALGQVENLLGVKAEGAETLERLYHLFADGFSPNLFALVVGLLVIALMIAWPAKWGARVPGSLAGVIAATAVSTLFGLDVAVVGDIPRALIHDTRLTIPSLLSMPLDVIFLPALSIASLGMIESLLCGAAGGRMKGEKLKGDRELIAQGIGNVLLPFLGGVPATAAIARTSVAIKSGCRTRLTGIVHGVVLLLSMFLFSPLMSRIPLSALAGVLMVTAWRMNEWHSIKYIFGRKFHWGAAKFLITMVATVVFDLTVAIAAGVLFAILVFFIKISDLEVTVSEIDPKRLDGDVKLSRHTQVVYVTGPMFFGAIDRFETSLARSTAQVVIFSMRGVPYIDTSGAQALYEFCLKKRAEGVTVMFAAIQPKVRGILVQAGIGEILGDEAFFDNALDAIHSAEDRK